MGAFCEKTAQAFFEAVMEVAINNVSLSKDKLVIIEI